MDLRLLHVQTGQEGGIGQDIRGFQHALTAETGKDDVRNAVVIVIGGLWHE